MAGVELPDYLGSIVDGDVSQATSDDPSDKPGDEQA